MQPSKLYSKCFALLISHIIWQEELIVKELQFYIDRKTFVLQNICVIMEQVWISSHEVKEDLRNWNWGNFYLHM